MKRRITELALENNVWKSNLLFEEMNVDIYLRHLHNDLKDAEMIIDHLIRRHKSIKKAAAKKLTDIAKENGYVTNCIPPESLWLMSIMIDHIGNETNGYANFAIDSIDDVQAEVSLNLIGKIEHVELVV